MFSKKSNSTIFSINSEADVKSSSESSFVFTPLPLMLATSRFLNSGADLDLGTWLGKVRWSWLVVKESVDCEVREMVVKKEWRSWTERRAD